VRDAVAAARGEVLDVADGDAELRVLEEFVDVVLGLAATLGGRLLRLILLLLVEALEAVLGEVKPMASRLLVLLVAKELLLDFEANLLLLEALATSDSGLELCAAVVNLGLDVLAVLLLLLLVLFKLLLVVPGGRSVDRVEEVGVHDCTWRGKKVTRDNRDLCQFYTSLGPTNILLYTYID
jgi:hypothetical protein